MKRDMELCRKILFKIEGNTKAGIIFDLNIEGYEKAEIMYNCQLLHEAGLIKGYKRYWRGETSPKGGFSVGDLTWEGHDFLDNIREETVWNKIKDVVAQKGITLTIEIIKEIAPSVILQMIKGM